MVSATRERLRSCPIKWKPKQVAGHQDKHKRKEDMNRYEQLNEYVDGRAVALRIKLEAQDDDEVIQWTIGGEKARLWIGSRKISMNMKAEVIEAVHGPVIIEYWKEKGKFHDASQDGVVFDCMETALKGVPLSRRLYVLKFVSTHCPANKKMLLWKKRDTD